MAHKGSYGGKKNDRRGVPEPTMMTSGGMTMPCHGAQKHLGSMSMAPKEASASMHQSSSGRKRNKK